MEANPGAAYNQLNAAPFSFLFDSPQTFCERNFSEYDQLYHC